MSYITWVSTVICLTGTVLNCKKKIACFYLWAIGNVLWLVYDLKSGLYSRAILDIVQLILALYGIYEWKKE